jgi:hypothetical protein
MLARGTSYCHPIHLRGNLRGHYQVNAKWCNGITFDSDTFPKGNYYNVFDIHAYFIVDAAVPMEKPLDILMKIDLYSSGIHRCEDSEESRTQYITAQQKCTNGLIASGSYWGSRRSFSQYKYGWRWHHDYFQLVPSGPMFPDGIYYSFRYQTKSRYPDPCIRKNFSIRGILVYNVVAVDEPVPNPMAVRMPYIERIYRIGIQTDKLADYSRFQIFTMNWCREIHSREVNRLYFSYRDTHEHVRYMKHFRLVEQRTSELEYTCPYAKYSRHRGRIYELVPDNMTLGDILHDLVPFTDTVVFLYLVFEDNSYFNTEFESVMVMEFGDNISPIRFDLANARVTDAGETLDGCVTWDNTLNQNPSTTEHDDYVFG